MPFCVLCKINTHTAAEAGRVSFRGFKEVAEKCVGMIRI
jgi:hypothetical protein